MQSARRQEDFHRPRRHMSPWRTPYPVRLRFASSSSSYAPSLAAPPETFPNPVLSHRLQRQFIPAPTANLRPVRRAAEEDT